MTLPIVSLALSQATPASQVTFSSLDVGQCFYVNDDEHHRALVIWQKINRQGWEGWPLAKLVYQHPSLAASGYVDGSVVGFGVDTPCVRVNAVTQLTVDPA